MAENPGVAEVNAAWKALLAILKKDIMPAAKSLAESFGRQLEKMSEASAEITEPLQTQFDNARTLTDQAANFDELAEIKRKISETEATEPEISKELPQSPTTPTLS